jgi:hypothetical protein
VVDALAANGAVMGLQGLVVRSAQAGRRLLNACQLDLVRHHPHEIDGRYPADLDPESIPLLQRAEPFTMTSRTNLYAMYQAVRHVVANDVPGAIVECGVWRGGNMLLAADTLVAAGETDRELFLFDTFEGLPDPGPNDIAVTGRTGSEWFDRGAGARARVFRCEASLAEVRAVMDRSPYPKANVHLVMGMVENTIPERAPDQIALLRLDTDWYASTKHELEHLYPRVAPGGVVIIDDYGWWKGARQAVDEYFVERGERPFLQRIDLSARLIVLGGTAADHRRIEEQQRASLS